MTYAGFFVHLSSIPPVLRWLQWLCPLKYTLEALSVNEVGSGLMIQDTLQGVPINISAALIMNTVSIGVDVVKITTDVWSSNSSSDSGRTITTEMSSSCLRILQGLVLALLEWFGSKSVKDDRSACEGLVVGIYIQVIYASPYM